jgi:hypothetical protein
MVAKIGDPEQRQSLRIARAYAIGQYAPWSMRFAHRSPSCFLSQLRRPRFIFFQDPER